MGLLDTILSTIDAKKRSAKRGIMDMLDNPQQWADMQANRIQEDRYGGAENAKAMKQYLSKQPYDQKALTAANDALRNAAINESLGAVTAWHGSPHKFDKFDMSKIGTGEGAQAYGHGLYLAESPEVAKNYRNVLSDTLEVKGDALPIEKRAAQMALTFGDNTADGAIKWLSKFEGKGANHTAPALTPEIIQSVKAKFSDGSFSHGGALYKTDIPDEAVARFLDWDKPLSQQAPEVQDILYAKGMDKIKPGARLTMSGDAYSPVGEPTGADIYNRLSEIYGSVGGNGSAKSTEAFGKLGIPGIRYLDGGSRSAGQGSSNFVSFDPEMIRILERNGQPTGLQPWAKGEWKGLLDEPAPKLTEFEQAQKSFNDLSSQVESAKSAFSSDRSRANLNEYNRLLQARDDAQSMMQQWQPKSAEIPVDYKGQHSAPMKDSGAPLNDITKGGYYPDDVYGMNGLQYYGTGNDNLDRAAYSVIRGAKGNPTAQVKMYRAVPNDAPNVINNGDWVTTVRQYAKEHGDSALNGDYRIVSKTVPAKKLFTNGDSWLEFGYDESGKIDPRLLGAMGTGGLLGLCGYSLMNDK